MNKRILLFLGLVGLLLSGVRRASAVSPAQVDATGYGGASSGEWACGPSARATYAGAGGSARVYPHPDEPGKEPGKPETPDDAVETERHLEPHGASIGAAGAVEQRGFERLSCANDPCGPEDVVPPRRALGAGRVDFGYDTRSFGVQVGAMLVPYWREQDDSSPSILPLPAADFRFGRRMGWHAGFGVGNYNVPTLFRPGLYGAVGYATPNGVGIDFRAGPHAVFDGELGFRGDLALRYQIGPQIAPGLGLALSRGNEWLPEGRVFMVFTP